MAGRKKAKGRAGGAGGGEDGLGGAARDRRPEHGSGKVSSRTLAELRAFAHPLRLQLFELFAEKPRTTMQVAEILGQPPTRLYHHVNALQKSGLVRLRETRPNRGTVEKYFEAVNPGIKGLRPRDMLSNPRAMQSARAAAAAVFEQSRQDLFAELRDLGPDPETPPILARMLLSATPARASRIRKRLMALLMNLKKECGEKERSGAPAAGREAEGTAAPGREAEPGKTGRRGERWALTIAFARSWTRGRTGKE